MHCQRFLHPFGVIFYLFFCSFHVFSAEISPLVLQQQIQQQQSPLILDVRSEKEFKKGHLEGAVHIPVKQLKNRLSQLTDNQNEPIVVYCYSGPRAVRAMKILRKNGFHNLRELEGHYEAWTDAGLPVVVRESE